MAYASRGSVALPYALLAAVLCIGTAGAQEVPQTQRRVVTGDSTRLPADDVAVLRIHFEAGARTHWHFHANPQIYLVEAGRGRIQVRGEPPRDVATGEPVLLPANVPHWHGASVDAAATCLQAYPGGVAITMLEEVTDEEYLGTAAPAR